MSEGGTHTDPEREPERCWWLLEELKAGRVKIEIAPERWDFYVLNGDNFYTTLFQWCGASACQLMHTHVPQPSLGTAVYLAWRAMQEKP